MDGATRYVQEQVIPQLRQMDRFKGFIGLGEYVHDCCTRLWPLPSSLHLCLAFCLQIDVFLSVGLPGLEPGTSSLSEKHNALHEVSRVCNIPANRDIFYATIFLIFQDIRLGCCTVAAHTERARKYSNRSIL